MTIEVKFEEYDLSDNFLRILKGVNLEDFDLMSIHFKNNNQSIIIKVKPSPLTEKETIEGLKEMGVWQDN